MGLRPNKAGGEGTASDSASFVSSTLDCTPKAGLTFVQQSGIWLRQTSLRLSCGPRNDEVGKLARRFVLRTRTRLLFRIRGGLPEGELGFRCFYTV
jgi:hypothetical protein